jgi:hypothetical protein
MSARAPPAPAASARALGAATGFYAAWFLSSVVPLPLVWYLPLARRFEFAPVVPGLAMDFYGRLLLAIAVGALAGLVAARARLSLGTLALWVASTGLLCVLLEGVLLWQRVPAPLQTPG